MAFYYNIKEIIKETFINNNLIDKLINKDMEEESTIKLILKDGMQKVINKKAAQLSELLKATLKDKPNITSIPLENIQENNAIIIIEYLTHLNGIAPPEIEKPISTNEMEKLTDKWSAKFINSIPLDDLVSLSVAASYMGINCLSDLCCAKIASLCRDKTDEEIFKTFNINETFTEDEKDKIREENKWIEENLYY